MLILLTLLGRIADELSTLPGPTPTSDPEHPMQECRSCGSDLVNIAWHHQWNADAWLCVLRCGACGHERAGLFPHDECVAYEEHLNAGVQAIEEELETVVRERELDEMRRELDTFVGALRAGAIAPEDFDRR